MTLNATPYLLKKKIGFIMSDGDKRNPFKCYPHVLYLVSPSDKKSTVFTQRLTWLSIEMIEYRFMDFQELNEARKQEILVCFNAYFFNTSREEKKKKKEHRPCLVLVFPPAGWHNASHFGPLRKSLADTRQVTGQ